MGKATARSVFELVFIQMGTAIYAVTFLLLTVKFGLWFAGVLGLI